MGLKKKLRLWWEKKTNLNPYGVCPEGACPVQAEGFTKEGKWYYFRARGSRISFVICESEKDYTGSITSEVPYLFEREMEYGDDMFQAGLIKRADAVRLITVWLNEYYVEQQTLKISKKTQKWLNNLKKN